MTLLSGYLFAAVLVSCLLSSFAAFSHGWGSVGDQLAGNFGTDNMAFNNSATFAWIASHYSVIAINGWFSGGRASQIEAARELKSLNPKIKILWWASWPLFPCSCISFWYLYNLLKFTSLMEVWP